MSAQILPLGENDLQELSDFLCNMFGSTGHQPLFLPDLLRWKYLDPAGFDELPRSLLVREAGRVVAHLGMHVTAFGDAIAMHPLDWAAARTRSPNGLGLLMRAHRMTDTQYVMRCTEAAAEVLVRIGYRVATVLPLFQKVLDPIAWRHMYGGQPLWKRSMLRAVDRSRSVARAGRVSSDGVALRPVTSFGDEVQEILQQSPSAICSSRATALLNHYLRFPSGSTLGWHVYQDSQLRGFALTNVVQRGPIRLGKVLDCHLDTDESKLWQAAILAITQELRTQECHQVVAYGSAPWSAQALRRNGFFERGRTPLYWRDVKSKVALDKPFHLTHLEADNGYL